ncbi:TadE family protein [Geomonas azotofigens]|uniref:TadE family protein n=1 Tax=Geomonas azotofigens TaxID=2843196 RepID=UPI001C0F939D|nr:TadE/TadG family type IV pilus assembly protein [Geomonas azotofigens]MBU5612503.1 pilus assembly protein [Geomonas azotofigens]
MKDQKGQALVEAAIILPLVLLLIMGLFEFGRAMFLKNTLNNAARAGARTAVVTPKYDATTHPNGMSTTNSSKKLLCTDSEFTGQNGPVYRTICNSIYNGIIKTDVTVDLTITELENPSGLSTGDSIDVKLTWDKFQPILPVLIPITNTIAGEASMRYE